MRLHEEIAAALNQQATLEASSAITYFSMTSWFENQGFRGFANWCRVEAEGEMRHMTRVFDYINKRGHQVEFNAIPAPEVTWNSPLEVFQAVYDQEVNLTRRISELMKIAQKHSDHATESFLNTFIMEQIEDEAAAGEILAQIKMVDGNSYGLLMVSNNLENRKAAGV